MALLQETKGEAEAGHGVHDGQCSGKCAQHRPTPSRAGVNHRLARHLAHHRVWGQLGRPLIKEDPAAAARLQAIRPARMDDPAAIDPRAGEPCLKCFRARRSIPRTAFSPRERCHSAAAAAAGALRVRDRAQ